MSDSKSHWRKAMLKDLLVNYKPRENDIKAVGELKEILRALESGKINMEKFMDLMAAKEADLGLIEQYAHKELPKMPVIYAEFHVLKAEQKRAARRAVMENDEAQVYLNDMNRVVNENLASIHWLNEHITRYEKMGAVEAVQRCRNVLQSHTRARTGYDDVITQAEAERRYQ
jgi:hypothetical protein